MLSFKYCNLPPLQTESYSTRSATRSGIQTLLPASDVKFGKVPKTTQYVLGGPIGKLPFLNWMRKA